MSNVDYDFIKELEGYKTRGYVPMKDGQVLGTSGVTIAAGTDLGTKDDSYFAGLPEDLIAKLRPFYSLQGAEAAERAGELVLSDAETQMVFEHTKAKELESLKTKWQEATGNSFDELPTEVATTIASVAFQYGDLASKTPNFWKQMTSGDYDGALSNLRDFGDAYGTRRNKEADLFEPFVSKKKLEDRGVPLPEEGSFEAIFETVANAVQPDIYNTFALPDETPRPKRPKPGEDFRQGVQRYGDIYEEPNQELFEFSLYQPNMKKVAGSAFRQYNPIYSLSRLIESQNPKYRPVEGYSVYNDPKAKELVGEDGLMFYDSSHSHEHFMLRFNRRQEDLDDMAAIEQARGGGVLSTAMALAGPSTFSPLLPMKVMRAGKLRRFFGGSATVYATTAPQQMLIESQNEARDATHAATAVTAGALLGGALALGFGKGYTAAEMAVINQKAVQDRQILFEALGIGKKAKAVEGEEILPKAAGANVSPEIARKRLHQQLDQEGLESTGVGLEALPMNPVIRMMSSPNPLIRPLAAKIVDIGGLMPKKIRSAEEATEQSAEKAFQVNFLPTLREVSAEVDRQYLKYRNIVASDSDIGLAGQMIGTRIKDIFTRTDGTMTIVQFRNRVGRAMARNDIDDIGDAASPFVTKAAQSQRRMYDLVKKEATEVRLFERPLLQQIATATAAGNKALVAELEASLKTLRERGVVPNTAPSYVPRIYRVDRIMDNPQRFTKIVSDYFFKKNRSMTRAEADKIAMEVMDTVTKRKPFVDFEGADDALDWMKNPTGAQARTLLIPDDVIEEFLERDIEVLTKHHVKTMGVDIELTRKFGSPDMQGVIDDITKEYQRMIDETVDFETRGLLAKQMEADLRDLRGLRDRVRGTYGASKDPHALSSRAVRVMKSINVLTGMGSAMVSSVPDIARVMMVEGFTNAYYKGFARMFDEQAARVARMSKKELDQAGVAIDAVLGLRAHAMADIGDIFGNRYGVERSLNEATGMFFVMNGLNLWNQAIKEIAGNVTMLRMTDSIMRPKGWKGLSQSEKEKLLKNGINQSDYNIMRSEIKKHGQKEGSEWLPNTDAWTDPTQRLKFRIALNQNVDRIIITPGAGDRALWTSTELGSMLTQFKSFGQGAHVRMLVSGMQEKDGAFWSGAFLLVGLAAMINEVKRAQYGIDSDETPDQKLLNAIDRSGLLGSIMDINNATEKLSNYGIGMRPILTDQAQYPVHATAKASATLGPSAAFTMNASSVIGDIMSGNITNQTKRDMRFMFPTGNLWWMDPVQDQVFGESNVSNVNRQQ